MDKQSQVNCERQTIRIDFITLQGKPKHTEECILQKWQLKPKRGGVCTNLAVPNRPRLRIKFHSLWYMAFRSQYHSPPGLACAPHGLEHGEPLPRLVDNRVPLPDQEGTRLTGPIPGKCLVHSNA